MQHPVDLHAGHQGAPLQTGGQLGAHVTEVDEAGAVDGKISNRTASTNCIMPTPSMRSRVGLNLQYKLRYVIFQISVL